MVILSISLNDLWPFGENKGIKSVYVSQKGFVDRGHKVYFLCPLRKSLPLSEQYDGICVLRFRLPFNINNISVYNLPLHKIFTHLKRFIVFNLEWIFFQIYSLIWLVKTACRIKPDIIYVHGLTPAFPAWLASKIFKTRLVFRVYGLRDLYWLFKRPLYRIKECRDLLALKLNADYFIITKDGTKAALLAKSLGVQEEKIINYRNGVDFEIYNPNPDIRKNVCESLGITPNSKIILSLNRLITFYNVDRLIFSLPQLFKSDSQIVCIVAGGGSEKTKLEEFVKKNGIEDRVFFLGFIDRQYVVRLLNSCDVYVSLSKYSNTNNSLFEAMVCAKCIVSVKDDTIEEILTHRKNGFLVSPKEIGRLPNILQEILADESMRVALGREAQVRAKEVLESWQQRIDKEIQLLESLVKSKK